MSAVSPKPRLIKNLGVSLGVFFGVLLGRAWGQDSVPNVIIVLVDDLGWTDLGCYGSDFHETPHIDRLAVEGMLFREAYAAASVCSPTRAALLTGRHPARLGITDWIRARFQGGVLPPDGVAPEGYAPKGNRALECPRNPLWLELEEYTLAEALAPIGFVSSHIGKWHLGMDDWYPEHQGFQFNLGGCDYGQPPSYFDPYRNDKLEGIPTLAARKEGEYLTDREGEEAENFIRNHSDQSFFLYYSPYAVHTPIQARADLESYYLGKKPGQNHKKADYAAMVHSVDLAVGRILEVLDELKLSENTLIFLTSDNGGLLGPTSNAPLRGGKGSPYEGGLRVPMLVRWPAKVPAGSVSEEPVVSMDILPTVLEAVEQSLPEPRPLDGESLYRHLLSGGQRRLKRPDLYWHFPHYRGSDIGPYSVLRHGDWKLIKWWESSEHELFNVAKDPGEQKNLAKRHRPIVERLKRKLKAHLSTVGAQLPR